MAHARSCGQKLLKPDSPFSFPPSVCLTTSLLCAVLCYAWSGRGIVTRVFFSCASLVVWQSCTLAWYCANAAHLSQPSHPGFKPYSPACSFSSQLAPVCVTTSLLCAVLCYMTYKLAAKGWQTYNKEGRERQAVVRGLPVTPQRSMEGEVHAGGQWRHQVQHCTKFPVVGHRLQGGSASRAIRSGRSLGLVSH